MNKKVTIKDIARIVGVSHPVVSAVLKNRKSTIKFSEKTRQRVIKVAKELNYKPNILARSFQKQQSFLVGILFNGVNQLISSDFLHGLQSTLSNNSYSPITFIHNNRSEELEYLERCMEREVEGLIVNTSIDHEGKTNGERFSRLAKRLPIVEVFSNEISDVPSLNLDFYSASLHATRHLIAEGHKTIALYIHDRYMIHESHPGLYFLAWQYKNGYHQAIQEAGLSDVIVTHPIAGEMDLPSEMFTGASQNALSVLDHPTKPTAILCLSHEEVDAIVMAMVASGRLFPKDFHLISPGNPSYAKVGNCRMSMLVPPIRDVGKQAAISLFEIMGGKKIENMAFTLKLSV